MLSGNLYKLATILKHAIRTPDMEGVAEEYHVPWELVTEMQKIVQQYVNFPLKWRSLKDENPLPSEVKNLPIPQDIGHQSDDEIRHYSAIHRVALHSSVRDILINLFVGIGFDNSVSGPIFWLYLTERNVFELTPPIFNQIEIKFDQIASKYNLEWQDVQIVDEGDITGMYIQYEMLKKG